MGFTPAIFPSRDQNSVLFTPTGVAQIFEVPETARSLDIMIVGPGGNGGAGFSAAAAAARGGGGGGASGGVTRIRITNLILPRVLYVNPGLVGQPSYVGLQPANISASNIGLANAGGSGGTGSGAAGGAPGTAAAVSSLAAAIGSWLGIHEFTAGIAGIIGGAQTGVAGGSITWGALGISPGASGGGTTSADFSGGNITGAGLMPTNTGGAAGSNNGNPGYWRQDLLIGQGGSGGGSSNAGVGGAGGSGAPGCGGGGGGGGTTGGAGGAGGSGFIYISAVG